MKSTPRVLACISQFLEVFLGVYRTYLARYIELHCIHSSSLPLGGFLGDELARLVMVFEIELNQGARGDATLAFSEMRKAQLLLLSLVPPFLEIFSFPFFLLEGGSSSPFYPQPCKISWWSSM